MERPYRLYIEDPQGNGWYIFWSSYASFPVAEENAKRLLQNFGKHGVVLRNGVITYQTDKTLTSYCAIIEGRLKFGQ